MSLSSNYKPSTNEPYMNPQQLEYFRQKLLKWGDIFMQNKNAVRIES